MPFHHKNEGGVSGAHQARCDACPAKKDCCPDTMKQGRSVSRSFHTETLNIIAERVASEEGAEMKRARSIACEGAFARIKNRLHWKRCSMWGKAGVQAELAWRVHPDVPARKYRSRHGERSGQPDLSEPVPLKIE